MENRTQLEIWMEGATVDVVRRALTAIAWVESELAMIVP